MSKWSVSITKVANMGVHKMLRITCEIPQEFGAQFIQDMGWPTEEKPISASLEGIVMVPQPTEEKPAEDSTKVLDRPLEKEPARSYNDYPRRAGIMSSKEGFWNFIEAPGFDKASFARHYIKNQLKVQRFRDIVPGSEAALLFDSLELNYKLYMNSPRYVETP